MFPITKAFAWQASSHLRATIQCQSPYSHSASYLQPRLLVSFTSRHSPLTIGIEWQPKPRLTPNVELAQKTIPLLMVTSIFDWLNQIRLA
ncbi:hypothetical protein ACET9K_09635 [Aeromonas enteropelogenes]|uniref:hypothetical protein n=1 Tax=Aeromonas enteropelogenes TaxID=29489 RepID=UPI0038CFDDEF